MFWDIDLSKTAAAIATLACVGPELQELAVAFILANNTGALILNSFRTSYGLNSNKLLIDEDRNSDRDGSRLQSSSHSLRIVLVTSFTVASRKVGDLNRVRAVYAGFLYRVVFTSGLKGEWIR